MPSSSPGLRTDPINPEAFNRSDFDRPYKDPRARDDSTTFPLNDVELSSVSDDHLAQLFLTAPKLYEHGHTKVVRLSKTFAMKGGEEAMRTESKNMNFARESLGLRVPKVYRIFEADIHGVWGDRPMKYHFIVMDYLFGPTVEECWDSLDQSTRESVGEQVAEIIEAMQSRVLKDVPPGPIEGDRAAPFEGPWFTDYGAGPFETLQDLEDWCNHKIDVCIRFQQLPHDAERFRFRDMVFTHQDIAPRNLILDPQGKVWLIDWLWAGVYPVGFEQAVLREQARNDDFTEMVLSKMSDRQRGLTRQYAGIAYGLTTAARL